jgi:hypothetical protein
MISARKRGVLRRFSPRNAGILIKGIQEPFTTPFTALLGEKKCMIRHGQASFRDTCQAHLTVLAAEIKDLFSQNTGVKRGGLKCRLMPRLLENEEYKQFLGEAYAEELVSSQTPLIRAIGLVLFDLGMPAVSPYKVITPLPGGWLDLLVRGAQALIPEWRVSVAARKTSLGNQVEVLLCLDRVEENVLTLAQTERGGSALVH